MKTLTAFGTGAVLGLGVPLAASPAWSEDVPLACQQAQTLQAEREDLLEARAAELEDQISDGSSEDLRGLEKELKTVQTRLRLLNVAEQRLDRGRPGTEKCNAITTFVLRVSSLS